MIYLLLWCFVTFGLWNGYLPKLWFGYLFCTRWFLCRSKANAKDEYFTSLRISDSSNMTWDGNLFMSNDLYDYMIALDMIA